MPKFRRVALYMDMDQAHQRGIANGIVQYVRKHGNWRIFGAQWPMFAVGDLGAWDGDGIIAAIETEGDVEKILRTGLPVVDVSGGQEHPEITRIINDSVLTGEIAGRHLLDNGYTRFAFVACSDTLWSRHRLEGLDRVTRGARSGGIPVFGRKKLWWRQPQFSTELAEFLASQPKPLAVMAANDMVAMNVVGCCRMAQLRIPEDVAVVSVDNEELMCELSTPAVSSIPFDRQEIGYRAAERLDAMMRGELGRTPPPMVIPPFPLVERESSTWRSVTDDPLISDALDFIRKNATRGISSLDVVRHVYASRRSIEQRFRKQMGHSILTEIHRVRVSYAKKLLTREDDMAVSRVAAMSGFTSVNRFVAIFERYEGRTPQDFQKSRNTML